MVFLRVYLISNIFIALIILIVFSKINSKFNLKLALTFFRGVLIGFFLIQLLVFLLNLIFLDSVGVFLSRSQGPYAKAYSLMFACNYALPILLFFKAGKKFWAILTVSGLIGISPFFEKFVIISTSLHRDYVGNGQNNFILDYILSSLLIPSFICLVFIVIDFIKNKNRINLDEREDIL